MNSMKGLCYRLLLAMNNISAFVYLILNLPLIEICRVVRKENLCARLW